MCDEADCRKNMLKREEYNITKARRCDIECCSEDKCNDEMFTTLNVAEVPFISCLFVITSALAGFILGNN